MKHTLALAALASCVTAVAHAASPPPVPENLLACRKLQDEGERVRCYDAQIAKMSGAADSASAQATSTAPAAVSRASARPAASAADAIPNSSSSAAAVRVQSSAEQFGQEDLPRASRSAKAEKETAALLSSITAMRAVAPETYAIWLANGQVWRQEEASKMSMFFHVGDDVRIEKGVLGSYHMSTSTTGAKNWVRVTRVQ